MHRRSLFSQHPAILKWISETRQRLLASQIGFLLLQRSDPIILLKSNPSLLPSPLPSSLFLPILTRIRSQPATALRLFNSARSNLQFPPDISSISNLTLALMASSKARDESKKILEPILRSQPVHLVLDSMIRAASNCKDSRSQVLSFVLKNYSFLRLIPNSLETLRSIRVLGCVPSTASCNELLDALRLSKRVELAWVCYSVLVRAGFEKDGQSWSVLCRILYGQGKVKRAEKLLDLGVCGVSSHGLVVDCYCKNGDFRAAICVLNQMFEKNLSPCFSVYASFLDGGCKFGDVVVVNLILKEMIVRELLLTVPILDYDPVINMLCELEKTFVAEMFFGRAQNVNLKLRKGVYASLLRTLSKEGRLTEAIQVYRIMLQEGITMDRDCSVFLSGMCRGEPSEEVDSMLKILIGKGFVPSVEDLSMYIGA